MQRCKYLFGSYSYLLLVCRVVCTLKAISKLPIFQLFNSLKLYNTHMTYQPLRSSYKYDIYIKH